jgi:hypothetical protein
MAQVPNKTKKISTIFGVQSGFNQAVYIACSFCRWAKADFHENRVAMYLFMHDESNRAWLLVYYLMKFKQMYDIADDPFLSGSKSECIKISR